MQMSRKVYNVHFTCWIRKNREEGSGRKWEKQKQTYLSKELHFYAIVLNFLPLNWLYGYLKKVKKKSEDLGLKHLDRVTFFSHTPGFLTLPTMFSWLWKSGTMTVWPFSFLIGTYFRQIQWNNRNIAKP